MAGQDMCAIVLLAKFLSLSLLDLSSSNSLPTCSGSMWGAPTPRGITLSAACPSATKQGRVNDIEAVKGARCVPQDDPALQEKSAQ
jgi:hypothetical protein